jgi:hypothetical protein
MYLIVISELKIPYLFSFILKQIILYRIRVYHINHYFFLNNIRYYLSLFLSFVLFFSYKTRAWMSIACKINFIWMT